MPVPMPPESPSFFLRNFQTRLLSSDQQASGSLSIARDTCLFLRHPALVFLFEKTLHLLASELNIVLIKIGVKAAMRADQALARTRAVYEFKYSPDWKNKKGALEPDKRPKTQSQEDACHSQPDIVFGSGRWPVERTSLFLTDWTNKFPEWPLLVLERQALHRMNDNI